MAKQKVNSAQIPVIKSSDANNWTVYDYGSWKAYRKRVTFVVTVGGGATTLSLSSANFPVGVANLNAHFMDYSHATNGNAFGLSCVAEMTSGSSALNFTVTSVDGGSRTYTGHVDIVITGA